MVISRLKAAVDDAIISKIRLARSWPPILGSCTTKIGAFEKPRITRTSSSSFSGERNAGAERPTTWAYAEADPPHTAHSRGQPRELSSMVVGYSGHSRYGTILRMLAYLNTALVAKL